MLLANNRVVALHLLKTERKHIALRGQFAAKNLVTGKPFSQVANEIVFDFTGPDTRVFLLE